MSQSASTSNGPLYGHIVSIIAIMVGWLGSNAMIFYFMKTLDDTQFFWLIIFEVFAVAGMSWYMFSVDLTPAGIDFSSLPPGSQVTQDSTGKISASRSS